uniref:Uncharacterized protein n=1 Tax=Anguilla anguilla TaxID=7936 RepID=A0A0E9UB18_ANGAN
MQRPLDNTCSFSLWFKQHGHTTSHSGGYLALVRLQAI